MHAQTAMDGSNEKSAAAETSASNVASLVLILWQALHVRGMVLLSLLLQIALFVFGKRRKRIFSIMGRMILWFAYQTKDWVAIAALGKLTSTPHGAGMPTNDQVLGAFWAPLLMLHLGGPDTITAYSFQDTQLWTRHLLTLVVQSFLAFCVIYLLDDGYLYLLTIPLCFAGINKYIERILCLKVINSMKTKPIISVFKDPNHLSHPLLDHQESKIVLLGYALFSAMRPDVNDYLCHKEYPLSFKVRIRTYLRKTNDQVKSILQDLLEKVELSSSHLTHFDIAVVELGFIFDVVYTKAAFIYTRKGFILRLTSFSLSIGILLYFLTLIWGSLDPDSFITLCLLVAAVALDICAVFSILCSDWTVILMHNNCLVRKILQYVLQYFPCFLPQQKRWSARMGQFDLLDYCWKFRKARVYRVLRKFSSCDVLENLHRFKYTRFVEIQSCLKTRDVYQRRLNSFFSDDSFEATRGEKTLDELREEISDIRSDLEWSIKVDFDASIIAWHLATSICYHQDYGPNNTHNEAMETSKYLSDYMMYLLVIRPAMLLHDDCKSFWLDRALDELKDPLSKASSKNAAFKSLLLDLPEFRPKTAMENLPKYAGHLATKLNQNINRWELIKAMWIEMLLYAAHSCQHVNHVSQLGQYGREFLTIIWVMGGHRIIQEVIKEE